MKPQEQQNEMTPVESCNQTIQELYDLFDLFGSMYNNQNK